MFGLKVFSAPFVFFLLSFFPFSPQAAETSLASDSQWLALGHYRRQWTGGYRSTIDSPGFFCQLRRQNESSGRIERND